MILNSFMNSKLTGGIPLIQKLTSDVATGVGLDTFELPDVPRTRPRNSAEDSNGPSWPALKCAPHPRQAHAQCLADRRETNFGQTMLTTNCLKNSNRFATLARSRHHTTHTALARGRIHTTLAKGRGNNTQTTRARSRSHTSLAKGRHHNVGNTVP